MSTFHDYLRDRLETGGFSTEDVLAGFLPLLRQVLAVHAAGHVAPLEGLDALRLEGVRIWFEEARSESPRDNTAALRRIEATGPLAVTVVAEMRHTTELDAGDGEVSDLSIGDRATEVTRPVYLPGYVTWEHQVGHHDPLTDTFSLGMLLASLACGLDLAEPQSLKEFVAHRRNLFALHAGLHPVLAQAITRMTEIDRHRRVQDLRALLRTLENYRDQEVDFEVDLARIPGFKLKDDRSKQHVVLSKLRERLFEISKRNRLLHFRATMQTVNLTHASVPLSFDITSIRPDQILVWNAGLQKALVGEPISLNKYLNFAEALYLPSMLDRIMAEARRDQAEFGFGQLRLVICFLYWANLKEKPAEQFDSPLILLPVELKKRKGIRDTYSLEAVSTEAEVNPVIRHQFKQLYDIDLPEVIDLAATSLDHFFDYLAQKVTASEPAVTLSKVDRPRIELIHDKARRKLDQYRRRARLAGRGVRSFQDLDYSYDQANYHPLGITLFSAKIRPPTTRLRTLIEERPRPRSFATAEPEQPVVEKERLLYHVQQGGEDNPYVWNFDLCSVTLGNFKYRKMSLVRDYETLLDTAPVNPAFDATFSLVPRTTERHLPPAVPLDDRFHVVPSDPTQASAIEEARAGTSYIIQGPPGTGKSQTITNLIADYVARGKRVLFVCEKRAAIDVVYARLRQCGLGDLCCLIHDSQTDKKGFVMDLKQTYEGLLGDATARSGVSTANRQQNGRADVLNRLKGELRPLEQFDAAMQGVPPHVGIPLRQLLRRGVELRQERPELSSLERERLPDYATWWHCRERIASLTTTVHDLRRDGVLARHPLGRLSPRLAKVERPLELITAVIEAGSRDLAAVETALAQCGVPREHWQTLTMARLLVDYAQMVLPAARVGRMDLVDAASATAKQFADAQQRFQRQHTALTKAQQGTTAWRQKLPAAELTAAIEQAHAFERSSLAWLRPSWWRLRRILNATYDFRSHVVRPRWSQVLATLQKEYEELDTLDQQRKAIAAQFRLDGDVDTFLEQVKGAVEGIAALPDWLGRIHQALAKSTQAARIVGKIIEADEPLRRLNVELDRILRQYVDTPLPQLREELKQIQTALGELPIFLQCLAEIADLPAALGTALCTLPLTPVQLEAATADRSLADAYRQQRQVARFTSTIRDRHAARLERLYTQWLSSNAEELRSRVRQRFLDNVRISGLPAAQLRADEKELKKRYSRGRRDLEHEFGKSMRYKSIRDLVAADSGEVIKDLKPVWLMSPLSVSDTLPMDASYFDVVIFDEASQITLEEAVPSVFRAPQAIVVGDEMQLPPTDFFSARQNVGEEEEELTIEEAGEMMSYDLASNSFLNHAAKNLSSTMLGWHYRSRSESLVSFSNWAFYDGRLLTVPEECLATAGRHPIVVTEAAEAKSGADELLGRSISYHRMRGGVYDKRRNRAEAEYIAQLVRELLGCERGRSIGIVAFSEAQQDEIESALQRLAQDDAEFRDRLDAEREREVDGQFVGLLVKNLENIQGDERDIIILSVCYGYGPNGKMLMNFGPINKSGGERRLNVAFSRAKHHMAVVSSIQFGDITNDYNDGANCLKNYLRYAEAVSTGNSEVAHRVLHGMSRWHVDTYDPASEPDDPVAAQIAGALTERGYHVDRDVGQSHFRCDLAVRREGDRVYRLAILLDNDGYYDQSDLLERDLMRPKLLRDFGWTVTLVLAKDWYDDQVAVLERLEGFLAGDVANHATEDVDDELDEGDGQRPPLFLDIAPAAPVDTAAALNDSVEAETPTAHQGVVVEPGFAIEATSSASATRRFELVDGRSRKFWEITLDGTQHTARFGRIGAKGQSVTKSFETAEAARRDCERLIHSKRAKGYSEQHPPS